MNPSKTRVVVAMSGGVDSSVAAALLVEQGYDVVGMMMRLWSEESTGTQTHNRCCTPDQMADARRIADRLGIPFYVLDTREVFRKRVVDFFIQQYRRGLTPNPCIECNRHIRFEWLLENALALDAQYLATGHYARIRRHPSGRYELWRAVDTHKDQSYVLSVLGQAEMQHVLFPVGGYTKAEIRAIAAQHGLPTASKQDSQDLCFLGDGSYRRFLREHAPDVMTAGPIMRRDGSVVGEHQGLANYTIGQRKGLGVYGPEPLYVLATRLEDNALIVGTREELGCSRLVVHRVNWISGIVPEQPFRAEVQIRYHARTSAALIEPVSADRLKVHFDEPARDATPGQGAIIYDGDLCLGGGLIENVQ
jgi:tRNA-specific 2-thiouridylase